MRQVRSEVMQDTHETTDDCSSERYQISGHGDTAAGREMWKKVQLNDESSILPILTIMYVRKFHGEEIKPVCLNYVSLSGDHRLVQCI